MRGNHGDALESLEAQVREHREAAAEARLKCKEKDKAAAALQEQLRATEGQLAEQRAKLVPRAVLCAGGALTVSPFLHTERSSSAANSTAESSTEL